MRQVATKWHNFWRAKRRRPDGTVEPFLKVSADGESYDIASMDFVQLPADFQALTFATTSFVCSCFFLSSAAISACLASVLTNAVQ